MTIATAPKVRPILFSAEMVLAILAGRKTQTRRLIEPQPQPLSGNEPHIPTRPGDWAWPHNGGYSPGFTVSCKPNGPDGWVEEKSPYGKPGDRLWVRETYSLSGFHQEALGVDADDVPRPVVSVRYAADGVVRHGVRLTVAEGKKLSARVTARDKVQPGRFMYKSCSRILLDVTGVRVERLQAISEADAQAEGVDRDREPCDHVRHSCADVGCLGPTYKSTFCELWARINGWDSWAANPWVWVVTFKRLEMPEVRS